MNRSTAYALVASTCVVTACGTSVAGPDAVEICWVNAIHFDGVRFVAPSRAAGRDLALSDLGPQLATVRFRVDGNVEDPDYRLRDGDATYLEPGTPVFGVKGYRSSFRRAAVVDGQPYLFEADLNRDARRGADLLDIGGKVDSVGVFSSDMNRPLGVVSDSTRARALTEMVLQAPVEIRRPPSSEIQLLAFYLADGTAVLRTYRPAPALLSDWIMLPAGFRTEIEEAVRRGAQTAWTPQPLRSVGSVCGPG